MNKKKWTEPQRYDIIKHTSNESTRRLEEREKRQKYLTNSGWKLPNFWLKILAYTFKKINKLLVE